MNYLSFYSNCVLTEGVQRDLLVDLQRQNLYLIPKDMSALVKLASQDGLEALSPEITANEEFGEYLSFLLDNDLAHIYDAQLRDCFPPLRLDWEFPASISNAIVEIDQHNHLTDKLIAEMAQAMVQALQLRFYSETYLAQLPEIGRLLSSTCVRHVELVVPFADQLHRADYYTRLAEADQRIKFIQVYGAPWDEDIMSETGANLSFRCQAFSQKSCGLVDQAYFSLHMSHFTESQRHNTCLNRKIAIDVLGNIRNCPSMTETYGNVRDTSLMEAIEKTGFKQSWSIAKDQIAVCRTCEFRHVCTDCRAYREQPEDLYSKPLKCGYNPATCEWEDWSSHPMKQRAIAHYGMQQLTPAPEQGPVS